MSETKSKKKYIGFFIGHSHKGLFKQEYLSNFYESPFVFTHNDVNYSFSSNEQFFMWSKAKVFKDEETELKIIGLAHNPKYAKKLGRQVKNYDDAKWIKKRDSIMYLGLYLKFTQNKKLKDYLLSTEDSILVETSPYDKYWGCGLSANQYYRDESKWLGVNKLGTLLMQLRRELKNEEGVRSE